MLKRSLLATGLSIFILGCGSVAEDRVVLKESEVLEKPSGNLAPASVSEIRLSDIKIDEVTLSWSAAIDSDGFISEYYISYRTDNRDWSSEIRTEKLTLTIKNLSSYSNYEFRVRAIDNEGLSSKFTYASMSTDLSQEIVTEEKDLIIVPVLYQRSNINKIQINQTIEDNDIFQINIYDSTCWLNIEIDELLNCTDISANNINEISQSREFNINFPEDIISIQDDRLQVIIDEILNLTGEDKYLLLEN